MKLLKNLLLLATLAMFACKVDEPLEKQEWVNAEITGFDARLCPCCGGYFIDIKGKRYLVQQLPDAFQNFLNTADVVFPLKVQVKTEELKGPCPTNFDLIKVLEIEVRP
jgi:hypothetical protein